MGSVNEGDISQAVYNERTNSLIDVDSGVETYLPETSGLARSKSRSQLMTRESMRSQRSKSPISTEPTHRSNISTFSGLVMVDVQPKQEEKKVELRKLGVFESALLLKKEAEASTTKQKEEQPQLEVYDEVNDDLEEEEDDDDDLDDLDENLREIIMEEKAEKLSKQQNNLIVNIDDNVPQPKPSKSQQYKSNQATSGIKDAIRSRSIDIRGGLHPSSKQVPLPDRVEEEFDDETMEKIMNDFHLELAPNDDVHHDDVEGKQEKKQSPQQSSTQPDLTPSEEVPTSDNNQETVFNCSFGEEFLKMDEYNEKNITRTPSNTTPMDSTYTRSINTPATDADFFDYQDDDNNTNSANINGMIDDEDHDFMTPSLSQLKEEIHAQLLLEEAAIKRKQLGLQLHQLANRPKESNQVIDENAKVLQNFFEMQDNLNDPNGHDRSAPIEQLILPDAAQKKKKENKSILSHGVPVSEENKKIVTTMVITNYGLQKTESPVRRLVVSVPTDKPSSDGSIRSHSSLEARNSYFLHDDKRKGLHPEVVNFARFDDSKKRRSREKVPEDLSEFKNVLPRLSPNLHHHM
ncbi:hypothetical protein AKO1_008729 [Acrasis kona]|uniref:Uncharacterized protein n=1 Tax=Acrasis kona TaxID=1008807 RepID=A0AAW2ZG11_9EUKA